MNTKRHKRRRNGQSEQRGAVEAQPLISFIIPALNEERLIANTVGQFARLNNSLPYEVIVADGGSSDKTVEISRQLGAQVYVDKAKRKTIASGRNLGARFARGDLLVFCDADTQLENIGAFTQRILEAFKDARLVGAVPRLAVFPAERRWRDSLFSAFLNWTVYICFCIRRPFACGQCQVIRKTSFRAIKGYNRYQVHGEDSAIFRKLVRIGQIRFLWDVKILESPRRYKKLGYFKLIGTGLYSIVGQMIFKRNVLKSWERVD